MSGVQIATSSSQLTYAIQGYNGINLTNWTTSAASVIAAGSGVEVAGAFFRFSSDDTNDATSFSAIATNATAYLQLVPSGTAGSQIVTSSWASTAPTFRADLGGWYASAASSTRYVAGCVKTGATSYELKFIITPRANLRHEQAESFASGITVTGASVLGGDVTVTGNTVISGTATVGGVIISGAKVTATALTVTASVSASSIIATTATLSGALTAASVTATAATISGTATIGAVSINGFSYSDISGIDARGSTTSSTASTICSVIEGAGGSYNHMTWLICATPSGNNSVSTHHVAIVVAYAQDTTTSALVIDLTTVATSLISTTETNSLGIRTRNVLVKALVNGEATNYLAIPLK